MLARVIECFIFEKNHKKVLAILKTKGIWVQIVYGLIVAEKLKMRAFPQNNFFTNETHPPRHPLLIWKRLISYYQGSYPLGLF